MTETDQNENGQVGHNFLQSKHAPVRANPFLGIGKGTLPPFPPPETPTATAARHPLPNNRPNPFLGIGKGTLPDFPPPQTETATATSRPKPNYRAYTRGDKTFGEDFLEDTSEEDKSTSAKKPVSTKNDPQNCSGFL